MSLLRQWLMGSPPMPLAQMADLAATMSGPTRLVRPNNKTPDEDVLTFHAPFLLEAILAAFRDNRYGDRLYQFHRFTHRIHRVGSERANPLSGYLGPFYYFSDDELAGKEISIRTLRRLTDSPIDYSGAKEFGNPQGTEGNLHPNYKADPVFKNLFTHFDADFLLREIDGPNWRQLEELADKWRQLLMDVLGQEYWPKGRIAEGLVFKTIRLSLREEAGKMVDLVHEWSTAALIAFGAGAGRILRHAVENAQRSVLSGSHPVCVVVRTKADLMRSWKSYLGQLLNGRIVDELEARGVTLSAEQENVGDDENDPDALFD